MAYIVVVDNRWNELEIKIQSQHEVNYGKIRYHQRNADSGSEGIL